MMVFELDHFFSLYISDYRDLGRDRILPYLISVMLAMDNTSSNWASLFVIPSERVSQLE